jgi:DNA-binding MarR family transcriptional regulator
MPIAKRVRPPKANKSTAKRSRPDQLTNTLAFMRLLWAVDHGLRSLSKQMQTRVGMTGPQRLVLRIVGRFPDIMPSELAELLHLDRGTLSGILERLVTQQLLVRTPHEADRRSVLLSLSTRGRLLDRETPGTVEACVRRALGSQPSENVEAARQVLEAIARELARDEKGTADANEP